MSWDPLAGAGPMVYEFEHPIYGTATFVIRWAWEGSRDRGFFRPSIEAIEFDLFTPQSEQEALVADLKKWANGLNDPDAFRVREVPDRSGPNPLGDLPHRRKSRRPSGGRRESPARPTEQSEPEKEPPRD